MWMAITTLCLALYLAAIKRRQEIGSTGTVSREVLENYSVALVDRYAERSAPGALVFYSLFVISTNARLSITIPLVLFGLLVLVHVEFNRAEVLERFERGKRVRTARSAVEVISLLQLAGSFLQHAEAEIAVTKRMAQVGLHSWFCG